MSIPAPAPPAPPAERWPDVLCAGSVLWDVIGRTPRTMALGDDVPGRVTRLPGGVAMNIAMASVREGLRPILLTALGRDAAGEALAQAARDMGMVTEHVTWSATMPTDQYVAIEGENGLVAAIADAHSLEHAGESILAPLGDGRLGSVEAPFGGVIALDGNLTEELLAMIAASPLFSRADLRIAPASPGKATRLIPLRPERSNDMTGHSTLFSRPFLSLSRPKRFPKTVPCSVTNYKYVLYLFLPQVPMLWPIDHRSDGLPE